MDFSNLDLHQAQLGRAQGGSFVCGGNSEFGQAAQVGRPNLAQHPTDPNLNRRELAHGTGDPRRDSPDRLGKRWTRLRTAQGSTPKVWLKKTRIADVRIGRLKRRVLMRAVSSEAHEVSSIVMRLRAVLRPYPYSLPQSISRRASMPRQLPCGASEPVPPCMRASGSRLRPAIDTVLAEQHGVCLKPPSANTRRGSSALGG